MPLQILYRSVMDISSLLFLAKLGKMHISIKEYEIQGRINLANNPLENPPLEVIKRGTYAIIKYLQELEDQGTTELYEAKMIIIGEGGAGKTSLATKLMDDTATLPQEQETTKGIDIQEYYFKTKADQKFRINIWDFGGQEIYHATHQFFLTKRSLYVLVDDTRKDDKTIHDASFNYWLQTVELFGGDSPIVIVQNEKGGRSKDLDLKSMQARFSNIEGQYATNLLTCDKLPATKSALEFFIQQLPHVGQTLPKQWMEIRNALEEMEQEGTYYITLEQYFEVCRQHKIPEEDRALMLSQYLHDLGVFLHFQEDDLLRRVVILQNEWATDAVYKVLDCESVKAAKGRFTRQDLKTIWGNKDCKEKYKNMHPELLALMKNFELCYPLNIKEHTFLAPQLFPESQPDYTWDASDNLIFRYKYGFMPKGLLSRFIVRLNHYVQNVKKAWKNGVILQKNGVISQNEQNFAEVLSLYAQQEIRIRVKGKDNKTFLDIIIEAFDQLHNQFEGIKVDKFIPCICTSCQIEDWKNKYYFKYEVLQRAYTNNISEVQCQESFQSVNVYRLINDTLIAKKMEDFYRTQLDYTRLKQHSGAYDILDDRTKRSPIDKAELKDLLIAGEVNEIFEELLENAKDESLQNEILLLKTKWRTNRKNQRKGMIIQEVFDAENQRINKILLDWISAW